MRARILLLALVCVSLCAAGGTSTGPVDTGLDVQTLYGTWKAEIAGMQPALLTFLEGGEGTIETEKWGKEAMAWTVWRGIVTLHTVDGAADMTIEPIDVNTFKITLRAHDRQGAVADVRTGTMHR